MTIPSQCWDWPGFKNCNTEQGHEAYRFCASLHPTSSVEFETCRNKVLAENVQRECVLGLGCGVVSVSGGMASLPWATYHADTKAAQVEANKFLPGMGYVAIGTDGKLGPTSCAAIQEIIKAGKISGWIMPNACSGKVGTLQKKVTAEAGPSIQVFTAATPAASSAPAATAPAALPSSGDRNKKLAMIGGGVILALAGFYLWSKK